MIKLSDETYTLECSWKNIKKVEFNDYLDYHKVIFYEGIEHQDVGYKTYWYFNNYSKEEFESLIEDYEFNDQFEEKLK